jgi:hypothetical protein
MNACRVHHGFEAHQQYSAKMALTDEEITLSRKRCFPGTTACEDRFALFCVLPLDAAVHGKE